MSDIAIKEAEVRRVPVKDMKMAAYNPRKDLKPGDKEYEDLKRSMQTFGYVEQIVWNERTGNVVGGHQRLKVLKEAGATEVGVSVVDLDKNSEKALNIALNKIKGAWDDDKLADLLKDLKADDYDLELTGFDAEELEDLLGISTGEVTEDEVPEPPEEPKSKRGEIYELGAHRVMCGDSTSKADVAALIGGGRQADMVITDPPYNFETYGAGFIGETTRKVRTRIKDITDFDPTGIKWLSESSICSVFIFTSKDLILKYLQMFSEWKFNILTWCKNGVPPMTNNNFLPDIEYLLYFHRGKRVWNNGLEPISEYSKFYSSSSREGKSDAGEDLHPTMKPVALIAQKIKICSRQDGVILDPFGGSGTTLIAAEQLGRACYMMELDPRYVDVIIQRWETLTGGRAKKIQEGVE